MGLYKKEDLVQISYSEFGKTMDVLTSIVSSSGISFDIIVPLLRSGAFTAFHIAARLEIKNIIPVYYMYQNGSIVKRISIPELLTPISGNINILICDSCLTSGTTLKAALSDLKPKYPNAKFYAALAWLEEGVEVIPGIEEIYWGKRTNEHKTSTDPECINGLVVAPWEDFEIDWNEVKDY